MMAAQADSYIDSKFRSLFKVLLLAISALLFCQILVQTWGQAVFVVLLVLAIVVCIRLKRWPERMGATLVIFLVLPPFVIYAWRNTHPATLCLIFVFSSIGAYWLREHRLGRKPEGLKTHGAERTAVFPPEGERQ